MVGKYAADEADPIQDDGCPGNTRVARQAVIVPDASVVVELLTNGAMGDSMRQALAACDDSSLVPHSIDVEIVSALRRLAGTASRWSPQ